MQKILLLLIIVAIGAGGYVVYYKSDKLPPGLQERASNVKERMSYLASNGQKVGPAVMGITTESKKIFQEDETDKPIHQRALEFTQYEYCKVVVNEYEKTDEDNTVESEKTVETSEEQPQE